MGKDVYMFMIAPETGYLLAKKEGNHRVTESEAGDLYRFVEKDEKIEMGMETMDNPDSVSNALDFINSFGDNETTIYDFIQMTEFTHSDTNIMDVQNQFLVINLITMQQILLNMVIVLKLFQMMKTH